MALLWRLKVWTPVGVGPRTIERDNSFVSGAGLRMQVTPNGDSREATFKAKGSGILIPPLSAVQFEYHNGTAYVPLFYGQVRVGGNSRDVVGEEYTLRWQGRSGFARIAVETGYPIVPVGFVGGDDVYRSLTARDSAWGRLSQAMSSRFGGRDDMAMPLLRGVGPTLIPRPERMYLRFGAPIDTTTPVGIDTPAWVDDVKRRTQAELEQILDDLLVLRETDPYRGLSPLGWSRAARP